MFTSRAEYRLWLRADNADQRLTPRGLEIGCVGSERASDVSRETSAPWPTRRDRGGRLDAQPVGLGQARHCHQSGWGRRGRPWICWPIPTSTGIGWSASGRSLAPILADIAEQLTIDARYEGYLARQRQDIAAYRRDEALELPADLDYGAVGSLSNEVRQKLQAHRPATLGQAARISGVTPAALIALLKYVRRRAA